MSFRSYLDTYPSYHQHPVNKRIHLCGIPTIIVGIILLGTSLWAWGMGLIVAGSVLLDVGHRIEGNRPALTTNPIYILAAPLWWFEEVKKCFR